jgi:hypothetical protein
VSHGRWRRETLTTPGRERVRGRGPPRHVAAGRGRARAERGAAPAWGVDCGVV